MGCMSICIHMCCWMAHTRRLADRPGTLYRYRYHNSLQCIAHMKSPPTYTQSHMTCMSWDQVHCRSGMGRNIVSERLPMLPMLPTLPIVLLLSWIQLFYMINLSNSTIENNRFLHQIALDFIAIIK